MLKERLFSSGIMQMGPSRVDPGRKVGVFNPAAVSGLTALRTAEKIVKADLPLKTRLGIQWSRREGQFSTP